MYTSWHTEEREERESSVTGYTRSQKSSDLIKVKRYTDHTILKLKYCKPHEVRELMFLDENVQDDIYKLQRELTTHRIAQLQHEEAGIRRWLCNLSRSGIYSSYTIATQLSSKLSSIQSSIARLRLNVGSVKDVDTQKKIEQLQGYMVDVCMYNVGGYYF